MDCTQVLDDLYLEDATRYKDGERKQLGYLEIGGIKHAVYNGENFIGRDKSCSISVTSKALSKEHAVIEVIDEDVHLVYDLGSRNKTRIGKMVLQPHVRYQLPDGARLQLADVTAVYQRLPVNLEVDDGSNSETGSESMLSLINMVDKEESSQFNVLDAVIVPETPGPSCTKPKNVVIVQESPNSDMDSSFGMTNTCKTNVSRRDESAGVSVTEDKDFKNHSKVKQDTNDDSVFEAETQCDTDCPDMTKCSANTLHMSSVSHNDEVCASESDQEEDDLFEAETQCEEPSLKVLLKSSNANDSKNRNLALRSETVDAVDDDIYEAETQCVPGDIPNEKIGVNVASKGKLGSKIVNSLEERKVNIGTADRLCKTDRFVPNDMGDSPDEHGGEIYDAPTQYISGNGEKTSFMGKTDTFSVCSEQTKECMSSIKLSVDRKEDITDSSTLTEKKVVGSENKVDEAPSSNREDQQKEQTDSDGNSKVAKAALDASFNEDSFDHSMLEGDVDLFTYEGTCVIDSKEATLEVSNTTKTFSEVHSEGSKSESVSTNSNDTHANLVTLSKECTTKPSKSEKTVSGCGAFEKCTSSKSKLVQIQNDAGGKVSVLDAKEQSVVPLMKSLRPTNKETPKLSNGSGDETDPDDIFEVKAEANVSLNRNKKGSTKSFHHSSVKSSSDTVTTISKIKSKLSAQPGKDSGDETDPEDIFEARTQIHVPPVKTSKIVSKHSEPSSSKISRETSVSVNSSTQVNIDSGNAEDQGRICETQNQVVESQDEKNRKITNPEDSSKQDSSKSITSKPAVIRTKKLETPTQLSTEFKDNNNNDDDDDDEDIFCAPTQILPIPNENIHATKLPVSLRKEMTDSSVKISTQSHSASRDHDGNNDEDDNIYEAETQIAETPNRSSKSLTEISEPASEAEIKDIQAIKSTDRFIQEDVSTSEIKNTKKARATTQLDNDDVVDDGDIFEAPTQIIEVPSRSCKDFTEHSKSSPAEVKINAPAVKYGSGVKAPKLIKTSSGNENDGILEIGTQQIEVPDGNNKDFPKHSGSSSGKRSYHPSTQVSFGTVDDPEKGIYDAPTQKITDRIFKEIPSDDSTVVGSKVGSKKVSNSGQARQKTDQTILTNRVATIKHSSELSIDSSDETDTADICISVAGKVNSPDTSTSDAKELNKCELRESCVTEGIKNISENIRPTKVSATPDVQSRCDKWSEIRTQTTAEVIPQKESSEVPEVVVSTTDSTPGLRDGGFDGSKKSVAETGVDNSETVPPDKPKGTVGKSGMAESVIPDTPKPEMREAEEPHGSTLRAEKAGDGKRGMEGLRKPGIPTSGVQKENNEVSGMTESKKTNDSVLGTHGNGRGTSDMNEIKKPGDNMASDQGCFNGKHLISNSKKSDIKSTQKEDDSKCEGAGSEIPSDDKSSIHDGSGDKTDSENVLEANSQKIQVDRSSELNKVKKSAVPIDAHKNVDVVDKLIDDNLNDTFELIMPSSQDLMKAVKAYEAKQSPFKPEEVIPSEDEEPSSLTLKIPRHSHLKSKRAKVRKRPCTKSKASDATVVGSVKHLPDESSVDVSTISNAAAGTSRRRKLSYEDIDQSDKSDIILQASKQRRLSNKDPLENDSKNEVNDITSRRRSRRCPGEIQQIETEDVVNTDKENGKARTSKIVKGQDEIVASADSQTETNVKLSIETSRREKSLRSGVHRNKKEEQGFKSEQSNKPRKGRRRLKEVVESTEDNDNKETGKRSVDKKEDVENALATSIRPSIQQKMTCKIRDSLGSDKSEGSPAPEEERSKSRSRGRLSSNSQNEVKEKVELSTHRTLRSRKVSLSKPPSEELLKNSEDCGGNTSKDVKEKKITDSVPGRQNVSLRKSPGQSKGDGEVTSVTDLSKNRSPQKVARRNDIEIVSNRERKRKTEETVTEAASKRSKKAKSQENSADRCSPETSRPQRGVTHAKSADEERAEHLSAKQRKTEEKLSKTHSPSFENSVQNDEVKSPRRGRTRRKVVSSQKSEITETAKHDTKSGQRERTSRISKTDKTYKELENEPVTPKSRKINLSADQDITPQHARSSRGRGTPQSNIRLSSQKSDSSVSSQRRSTPRRMASAGGTAHHVLFTGFSDSKQEYVVRQLGGRVVDLPESCSVLVTDRVRRTYKFLCIMGRGKPIVSPEWLSQCQRSGCFVDPWKFLIKDHESESKFKFQLRESLEVAARTNLLAGYSVYVTPKVNPPPSEMKGIIESCGGVSMSVGAVKSWPVNSFIISCSDDKASWSKLKKSGKPIVGADVLLLGVLQQKLDLKSNTLV